MVNLPDAEKVKKLTAQEEKLDGESQHKKLRTLHRRLNRAKQRMVKLQAEEEKEVQEKNAPIVEELKKRVVEMRGEIAKVLAVSKREGRTLLKRVQRRLQKMRVLPFEERQKRTQKQSDIINKKLTDMTKGMKKVQANAFVHSLRKKMKSLNKRLKKFARIAKKLEAKAVPVEGEKKT